MLYLVESPDGTPLFDPGSAVTWLAQRAGLSQPVTDGAVATVDTFTGVGRDAAIQLETNHAQGSSIVERMGDNLQRRLLDLRPAGTDCLTVICEPPPP